MPGIDRWLRYLDRMKVRYSHSIHPRALTARETADADRVPAHEFAKTVVYFNDAGFGIAVVPADQFVDLLRLGRLLGSSFIRLASETELKELFPNCDLGAMPPFGDTCELPVIVDVGIAGEYIAFHDRHASGRRPQELCGFSAPGKAQGGSDCAGQGSSGQLREAAISRASRDRR